ncbi:Homeobox protein HD-6 [Nosema granulosis]|uniref:Homeobox protein HD-6 n=1 Tax=Nosema granulosis TaxID=83296 RepID=A0A9P6GWB7_9MICR|nr:Homeobox protein HD-6 [Nosema granulosis]
MSKKFKLVDVYSEIKTYYLPKNKPTKKRIRLSDWQEERLGEYFLRNVYPNRMEKIAIQEEIGVPARNIRIWFQNRRAKERGLMEEFRDRNLIDKNLIDRNLVDKNLVDRNLVDRNLIDRNLVDRNLVDKNLVDRNLVDRNLIDRNLEKQNKRGTKNPSSQNDFFDTTYDYSFF